MLPYDPQIPLLLILSGHVRVTDKLNTLLAELKPLQLYVYLSGVDEEAVRSQVTWPCTLRFRQDTASQGKDRALIAANKWFFRHETEGIVLNLINDWGCLPSADFLGFCTELLEKYRNDERIGHISCGRILRSNPPDREASYTFNHMPDLSFYATWRRVWQEFDTCLKTFRAFKKSKLFEKLPSYREFAPYWSAASSGKELPITAQYEYALLTGNRLCIVPTVPLVEFPGHHRADDLGPIIHPRFIVEDTEPALRARELQVGIPYKRDFDATGSAFLEDRLAKLTDIAGKNMKIPKIIHHVCDYPDGVPENLLALAATWKKYHPEWEQRFWDRQKMEEFVHTVCPDFEPYYRAFPHNVQRWDTIRYLILYHIGGMYVDLDYECFRSFDPILSGKDCYIVTEPALHARYNGIPVMLSNALMAAAPGDKFIETVIRELKIQASETFAGEETYKIILQSTGPLMLTRVYESLASKKGVTLLPDELFMPLTPKELTLAMNGHATMYICEKLDHAFAVHYFLGSW